MKIKVEERVGWTFVMFHGTEVIMLKANSTKAGCDLARDIAASIERNTDVKVQLSGLSM